MELDKLTREQVLELNIPTGVPLVYDFDDSGNITQQEAICSPARTKRKRKYQARKPHEGRRP